MTFRDLIYSSPRIPVKHFEDAEIKYHSNKIAAFIPEYLILLSKVGGEGFK